MSRKRGGIESEREEAATLIGGKGSYWAALIWGIFSNTPAILSTPGFPFVVKLAVSGADHRGSEHIGNLFSIQPANLEHRKTTNETSNHKAQPTIRCAGEAKVISVWRRCRFEKCQ